jgi:hypothetical protein
VSSAADRDPELSLRLFLSIFAIAGFVAARYVLFANGTLYTPQEAQWSNWIVAAGASLIAVVAISSQGAGASTGDRVALLSGLAAVIAGVIGIGSLLAPTTPRDAAAPACSGAAVAGGEFLATTVGNGANARRGPDESFPQARRFATDCTLSFDGYCVGQPEKDLIFGKKELGGLEDQRWLIVHRSTLGTLLLGKDDEQPMFVASGVVQSQSAESALGGAPSKKCKKYGGWSEPGQVNFVPRLARDGSVHLKARAENAILIGFSVVNVGRLGGNNIHRLSTEEHPQSVTGDGVAAATIAAGNAVAPSGPTLLVASACFAPNVEVPDKYAVWKISDAGDGKLRVRKSKNGLEDRQHLRAVTAACSTG